MRGSQSARLRLASGREADSMLSSGSSDDFDRKLEEILRRAAAVFCTRGYHQASTRDISHATRVSLSGLYCCFTSKEELLDLIQRHTGPARSVRI